MDDRASGPMLNPIERLPVRERRSLGSARFRGQLYSVNSRPVRALPSIGRRQLGWHGHGLLGLPTS
jgi:hypothetical protein